MWDERSARDARATAGAAAIGIDAEASHQAAGRITMSGRVAREFEQGVGGGAKERVVDPSRLAQREWIQRVRQCEDDVQVVDGQQFGGARFKPALGGQCLALRAVSIATRAPYHTLLAAVSTDLTRAAESRRAAAFDGSQHGELRAAQGSPGTEPVAEVSDEIGELESTTPLPAVRAGRRRRQSLARVVELIER